MSPSMLKSVIAEAEIENESSCEIRSNSFALAGMVYYDSDDEEHCNHSWCPNSNDDGDTTMMASGDKNDGARINVKDVEYDWMQDGLEEDDVEGLVAIESSSCQISPMDNNICGSNDSHRKPVDTVETSLLESLKDSEHSSGSMRNDNKDSMMDFSESLNDDEGGADFYNDITVTFHQQEDGITSCNIPCGKKDILNDNMFNEENDKKENDLTDNVMLPSLKLWSEAPVKNRSDGHLDNDHHYDTDYEDDLDDGLYEDDCTEITIGFKTGPDDKKSCSGGNDKNMPPVSMVTTTCPIPSTISTKNQSQLPTSTNEERIVQQNKSVSKNSDMNDDDDDDIGSVDDVMLMLENTEDDCSIDEFFHQQHDGIASKKQLVSLKSSITATTSAESNSSFFLHGSSASYSSFSTLHHYPTSATIDSSGNDSTNSKKRRHSPAAPFEVAVYHGNDNIFEQRRAQLAASMEASRRSRNRVFLQGHVKTRASLANVLRDIERSSRVVAKHVVRYWDEERRIQKRKAEQNATTMLFRPSEKYTSEQKLQEPKIPTTTFTPAAMYETESSTTTVPEPLTSK